MSQNGHLNSPAIGLNSPSLALNFEKRPNFGQILEIDPIRAFFLTFIYGKTKIFNTIRPRQKPAVKMNSSNTKSRIMFFSLNLVYTVCGHKTVYFVVQSQVGNHKDSSNLIIPKFGISHFGVTYVTPVTTETIGNKLLSDEQQHLDNFR